MSLQERIPSQRASVVELFVSEGSALVTPAGELDISNAGELREQLARPDVLDARQVCVDLNMVGFLDSSCIDLIVTACKRIRATGGSFTVACNARGSVRRRFEVDGLVEYLHDWGGLPATVMALAITRSGVLSGCFKPVGSAWRKDSRHPYQEQRRTVVAVCLSDNATARPGRPLPIAVAGVTFLEGTRLIQVIPAHCRCAAGLAFLHSTDFGGSNDAWPFKATTTTGSEKTTSRPTSVKGTMGPSGSRSPANSISRRPRTCEPASSALMCSEQSRCRSI